MKGVITLLVAGCVAREPVHPAYRYDYAESRSYDCPHASDKPDPRCEEEPKKVRPSVQSSTTKGYTGSMEAKQILVQDSQGRVRTELERYHTFRHGNHVEWTEEDGTVCQGTVLRSERNKIIVVPRSYDPMKVRLDMTEWQFWLRAPRDQPEAARFCLKGRKAQVALRHA